MRHQIVGLLVATGLCACNPMKADKHWDDMAPMKNEDIARELKICWDNHLHATQYDNSRGETVKVECYVTDGSTGQ